MKDKAWGCFSIIIVLFFLLTILNSCSNILSGGSSYSSEPSFSERAQDLGVTTQEYRDTYNYYRYGNP